MDILPTYPEKTGCRMVYPPREKPLQAVFCEALSLEQIIAFCMLQVNNIQKICRAKLLNYSGFLRYFPVKSAILRRFSCIPILYMCFPQRHYE